MTWSEEEAPECSHEARRKKAYQITEVLYDVAMGNADLAASLLTDLLKPGKVHKMHPVIDKWVRYNEEKVFAEEAIEQFKQSVTILLSRFPEAEAWWVHQSIATMFGALANKGPHYRRLIKAMVGLGDQSIKEGMARWNELHKNPKAAFFRKLKAEYKNKIERKHPGIKEKTEQLWRELTRASSHAKDVQTNHGEHKHTYPKDPDGGRRRKCPEDDNGRIICPQEQTYYIDGSEDEIYARAIEICDKDPDWRGKIKRWYFKECRPWFVREDVMQSCTCKYHNQMDNLMDDLAAFKL